MFVVFEGIDGSGKTTVSNLVVERLRASGLSVKHLRAEGKFASSVSESIRSLARDSKNVDLVPRAEFLLYVARDVQLIDELLGDALRTHDVVIADRFLYTAEVLARFGRALPASYVEPVIAAAAGELSPDLPPDGRPARLGVLDHRVPPGPQPLRQQAHLRGLAAAVDAFEGDENSAIHLGNHYCRIRAQPGNLFSVQRYYHQPCLSCVTPDSPFGPSANRRCLHSSP